MWLLSSVIVRDITTTSSTCRDAKADDPYNRTPPSSGGYGRDSYDADSREWILDDLLYRGQAYLHDRKTGLVYSGSSGSTWPRLVGKLRDGVVTEQKRINPGDLFQRLDDYLKTRQTRLKDLFDRFDSDRDGELSMQELSAMIRQQMPDVSRAELLYFQVRRSEKGPALCSGREGSEA